jgi:hypothetical protein
LYIHWENATISIPIINPILKPIEHAKTKSFANDLL